MDRIHEGTWEFLLNYCRLGEMREDPEVKAVLPVLYRQAVAYLAQAGVSRPKHGTPRRGMYDLLAARLTLDAWDSRNNTITGMSVIAENPAFRRALNQMKLTEPEPEGTP